MSNKKSNPQVKIIMYFNLVMISPTFQRTVYGVVNKWRHAILYIFWMLFEVWIFNTEVLVLLSQNYLPLPP
jgi:hypothetical protein